MTDVEDLTDEELAREYKTLHRKIEEDKGGYGKSDLYCYERIQEEARKRGFKVRAKLEVKNNQDEVIA